MKNIVLTLILSIATFIGFAQQGTGRRTGAGGRGPSNGHFYGKLIDAKTNKPIESATIVLYGNKFDTVTKKPKEVVLKTVLTASNGDFSIEGLPIMGNFRMQASAIGYKILDQKLTFGIKQGEVANNTDIASLIDKDLGNIKLEQSEGDLGNVTVTTTKQMFELGVDRKIFNVDKNIVSAGQTATEVMKSIPSLNVDIDGNVTLRNATPQIFIDGRPTTLTLDQIPADIIDKVELITNPSAKFDASGGNAGILNIVLKKNKKTGYNGGVRFGVDTRGRVNLGGDINLRENKLNFFASGNLNQRKSKTISTTDRYNYLSTPSNVFQDGKSTNSGYFGFIRGGLDYFIDNRNTISGAINYNKGSFDNNQMQYIDSSIQYATPYNSATHNVTSSEGKFENFGSQLSFKHNFAKSGHNISADANYNSANNSNNSILTSKTYPQYKPQYPTTIQRTFTKGYNKFFTLQTDYENPLTDNSKMEAGVRAAVRNFENNNDVDAFNNDTKVYDYSAAASSKYKFNDQVYAAYLTYSVKVNKWSYLLGLRAESSNYKGTLLGASSTSTDTSFSVKYPISLFPSAFITYKLGDKQDLQLNYSRRVNRPNFFQLMPFADYTTDPQNISIGNAGLKPEFTNSFELSYNYVYAKNSNFLATAFYKQTDDLISRYTYRDLNKLTGDSAYFFTYLNANKSFSYGLELTNKTAITKWWDATVNFNLFYSKLSADLPGSSISNDLVSWFAKMNNSFKVTKTLSLQFSGDYQAKTVLPQSGGGGGRGGGGGPFGGGTQPSAQGYVLPRYSFDMAIKKDWTWKNGQSGSLSVGVNDMFRTQVSKTYSEGPTFYQNASRRRDPQIVRVNFTYRFGKFDATLFKRKNTKADQSGGTDMGGGMQ